MGRVKPKRRAPVTATLRASTKPAKASGGGVSKDLVQKLASALTSHPTTRQAGNNKSGTQPSSAALSILSTLTQDSGDGRIVDTGAETTSVTSSLLTVKGLSSASRKKSSLATAQLIRQYHVLNKELSKCLTRVDQRLAQASSASGGKKGAQQQQKRSGSQANDQLHALTGKAKEEQEADLARIIEIRQQMENLGGLDMYQKASTLGQSKQRGGDSSRWLVPILQRIYFPEKTSDTSTTTSATTTNTTKKLTLDPPLRLLDVGALSPFNYQKQSSWIRVTPIDLNPQHPQIQKMDLLEMPIPTRSEDLYDVVCLSLVVNFVGDPRQRGEILRQATRCLVPGRGILYLVLPLPCIENSRYMDHELLVDMMRYLGCSTLIDHHFAKKLAYYAFRFDGNTPTARPQDTTPRFPKKLRHDKPNRNNFCIILQ
ncbi:hypothetical protein BGW41_006931 [Actinomortierella wolfii]|nr:hypothetical protein BGW41_006931 [Actinomortierella wolfii]